jgi:acyl-homoserine lactone acylase PvdQ
VEGPAGMESITLPLYYTHHGPIVAFDKEKNRAWSVKLPNFDGVNYSTGMYGLMKAGNLQEFKAVMSRQLMPRWNLLYSDSDNIFWVHNGNVARRNEKYDWTKPVPGWTKETEWGPYFPFEVYPQLLNPVSGFLQNCNNPPWVVTRNSGLKPLEPAPYYLKAKPKADAGEEALNTRGERLFQVLTQNKKFTLEEMQDLGFDTYIIPADVIVPLLMRAWSGAKDTQDARTRRAIELIRDWDRRSGTASTAYTLIYYWGKSYRDLFTPRRFSRFTAYSRNKIDIGSAEEQRMSLEALKEAVNRLEKRFGKFEVPWGQINVVVRGGTFPMDGTDLYGVLHPDEGVEQENGQLYCNDGWGHLLIVMEGEPKQIWSLLPYGQSEHPASPHYNDEAKLHSQRRVKRFWFAPDEILAHAESVWGDKDRIKALMRSGAPSR